MSITNIDAAQGDPLGSEKSIVAMLNTLGRAAIDGVPALPSCHLHLIKASSMTFGIFRGRFSNGGELPVKL